MANWREFKPYFYAYLVLMCVYAFTNYTYQQPDEWYQSLDLANFFVNGWTYGDGAYTHHRNLSVPLLLSLPMALLKIFALNHPYLVFTCAKLFTGLLNLVVLWGMHRLWCQDDQQYKSAYKILWVVFSLTLFSLEESVRSSLEHYSALAFWAMLGSSTLASPIALVAVGFFAVMTGITRYPSGILGVVYLICIFWSYLRRREYKPVALVSGGVVLGLVLGFLGDFLVYGRWYESLFMYLQYNLFSGLASLYFGEQSSLEYLTYVWKQFFPYYILFLPFFVFGLGKGLKEGIIQKKPWVITFLTGIGLHSLPAHKEPRFMSAFIFLAIFITVWGLRKDVKSWFSKKYTPLLIKLSLLAGIIGIAEHAYYQIFEQRFMLSQLEFSKTPCLVTMRPYPAFMYPATFLENPKTMLGTIETVATETTRGEISWQKNVSCPGAITVITKGDPGLPKSCLKSTLLDDRYGVFKPMLRDKIFTCTLEDLSSSFDFSLAQERPMRTFTHFANLPDIGITAFQLEAFLKSTEATAKKL